MRPSQLHIALLVATTTTASAADDYERGPAVQNPVFWYDRFCTDPAVTAEMNFERTCKDARGVIRIDLFNVDQSAVIVKTHDTDWATRARGLATKPYIAFTIDAGHGSQTIDFGDVRWFGNALGHETTRLAVRINDGDTLEVCDGGFCLSSERGFTIFDTNITNLVVEGLSGDPVTVEVAVFTLKNAEAAARPDHHLLDCKDALSANVATVECGDNEATLVEYRVYHLEEWATRANSFILK